MQTPHVVSDQIIQDKTKQLKNIAEQAEQKIENRSLYTQLALLEHEHTQLVKLREPLKTMLDTYVAVAKSDQIGLFQTLGWWVDASFKFDSRGMLAIDIMGLNDSPKCVRKRALIQIQAAIDVFTKAILDTSEKTLRSVDELKTVAASIGNTTDNLAEQVARLEKIIKSLKEELEHLDTINKAQVEANQSLEGHNEVLKSENLKIKGLTNLLQSKEKELSEIKEKQGTLNQKLDKNSEVIAALELVLKTVRQENNDLNNTVGKHQGTIGELEGSVKKLEGQATRKILTIEIQSAAIEKHEDKASKYQVIIGNGYTTINYYESAAVKYQSTIENQKQTLENLEAQKQNHVSQIGFFKDLAKQKIVPANVSTLVGGNSNPSVSSMQKK